MSMFQEVLYYDTSKTKYGIISYPVTLRKDLPIFIFLNAGLVNRQGPNRLYVKICRELNNAGFACFRFDLPGIGDNVSNGVFQDKANMYKHELKTVITYLKELHDIGSFVLYGMCTGADLAYDYALEEKLISGVCIINGTRIPNRIDSNERINKRYYKKYLTDRRRLLKFFTYKKIVSIHKYALMVFILIGRRMGFFRVKEKPRTEINTGNEQSFNRWSKLLNSNVEILHIVAEGSESFDDLSSLNRDIVKMNASRNNYREHIIYDADHVFTSVTSQQHVIAEVLSWSQIRFGQLPVGG